MNAETLWSKLLGHVVPTGVKRKLVLVAVFVELEKVRGMDEPRLAGLNAQMHLVDDETILRRLADLAGLLFMNKPSPVSKEASVVENCSEVMRWMPAWLRYGERDKMITDVAEVTVSHID